MSKKVNKKVNISKKISKKPRKKKNKKSEDIFDHGIRLSGSGFKNK